MCKDGQPCNGNDNNEVAFEYLKENDEAIQAQFKQAYSLHPKVRLIVKAAVDADKPKVALAIEQLCNDFYRAGITDVIRFGAASVNGQVLMREAEENPLDKLRSLIDMMKELDGLLPQQTKTVEAPFNDPADIDLSMPPGHQLDSAHVLDTRTGEMHVIDVRGKSEDEVRAAIKEKVDSLVKADA